MRRLGAGSPLIVMSVLVVAAIYVLRLDRVVGLIVDDAWYVLLAQALAQGHGYTMVNAPTPGLMPIDPPGFAAFLSLVFRLTPQFPDNVVALKVVSVVAMMGVGAVCFQYLTAHRQMPWPQALMVSVATVLTPGFVFLATSSVMAECVFTLVQLVAIVFAERIVRAPGAAPDVGATVIASALAAATMLIRSAGVALPAAVTLYLVYRRLWLRAALFVAGVAVWMAPWLLYSQAHRPTADQQLEHGGAHALTYRETFWLRWAGDRASGSITVRELPARVRDNMLDVFGRAIGGIVVPAFFRGAEESGQEVVALGGTRSYWAAGMGSARTTVLVSVALSLIAAVGFMVTLARGPTVAEFLVPVALAIILLWPHWTYRFVLPLAPFVFLYLWVGLEAITRARRRVAAETSRVARIAFLCLIGLTLSEHVAYILKLRGSTEPPAIDWVADAQEVDGLFDWMRWNLTTGGAVATTNPPLVYLRTGRKTVAVDDLPANWERWKATGVRYVVALRPATLPNPGLGYRVLYRSPRRGLWVLEI
jgi:hypothetical protein